MSMDPTKAIMGGCGALSVAIVGLMVLMNRSPDPAPANPPAPSPPASVPIPKSPEAKPTAPPAPPKQATRFDFKGDTPGLMTVLEFKEKFPQSSLFELNGRNITKVPGEESYSISSNSGLTVASAPVRFAMYRFLDGRLQSINLNFETGENGGLVLHALREKYGPPERHPYDKESLVWTNGVSSIEFSGATGEVSFSDVVLTEKKRERFLKALEENDASKKAAAKKDL